MEFVLPHCDFWYP